MSQRQPIDFSDNPLADLLGEFAEGGLKLTIAVASVSHISARIYRERIEEERRQAFERSSEQHGHHLTGGSAGPFGQGGPARGGFDPSGGPGGGGFGPSVESAGSFGQAVPVNAVAPDPPRMPLLPAPKLSDNVARQRLYDVATAPDGALVGVATEAGPKPAVVANGGVKDGHINLIINPSIGVAQQLVDAENPESEVHRNLVAYHYSNVVLIDNHGLPLRDLDSGTPERRTLEQLGTDYVKRYEDHRRPPLPLASQTSAFTPNWQRQEPPPQTRPAFRPGLMSDRTKAWARNERLDTQKVRESNRAVLSARQRRAAQQGFETIKNAPGPKR